MSELEHNELMRNDAAYRDLFLLKTCLHSVLDSWRTYPALPLAGRYKRILGDYDFIIGGFGVKKITAQDRRK